MAEGDRGLFNHWQERNIDTLDRDLLEPCRILTARRQR